jgi:hypothetical protein
MNGSLVLYLTYLFIEGLLKAHGSGSDYIRKRVASKDGKSNEKLIVQEVK